MSSQMNEQLEAIYNKIVILLFNLKNMFLLTVFY